MKISPPRAADEAEATDGAEATDEAEATGEDVEGAGAAQSPPPKLINPPLITHEQIPVLFNPGPVFLLPDPS